jgi:hypothetical protein
MRRIFSIAVDVSVKWKSRLSTNKLIRQIAELGIENNFYIQAIVRDRAKTRPQKPQATRQEQRTTEPPQGSGSQRSKGSGRFASQSCLSLFEVALRLDQQVTYGFTRVSLYEFGFF